MENKNEIENMSYSEIKEMINSGKIDLASLDVSVLQGLMDHETDMLCIGEGDVELISRCADVISERETELLSHDEFMSIVHEAADSFVTVPKKAKAKKFSLKRTLIIAASLALLIAACTFAVSTWGFSESGFLRNLIKKPEGAIDEIGGITIQDGGKFRYYSTVAEAIEKENLNIMYPASLPGDIVIEKILFIGDSFSIVSENSEITIHIITNYKDHGGLLDDGEVYQSGKVTYKLYEDDTYNENKYKACCIYNGYFYSISAAKYDDLLFVINNMKG